MAEQLGSSEANFSRIVSGKQAYTQDILEACAEILETTPAALLSVDPTTEPDILTLWSNADEREKEQIVNIANAIIAPKKSSV